MEQKIKTSKNCPNCRGHQVLMNKLTGGTIQVTCEVCGSNPSQFKGPNESWLKKA